MGLCFAVIAVLPGGASGVDVNATVAADQRGPHAPLTPSPPVPSSALPEGAPRLWVEGGDGVLPGPTVRVRVVPPAGATEMQVSSDPSFTGASWSPVGPSIEARVETGYQEIFGRFRGGAAPAPTLVTGVQIDPYWAVATANPTAPRPPAWIARAGPATLVVRLDTGRIVRGAVDGHDELAGGVATAARVDAARWTVRSTADGPIAVTSVHRTTRANGSGRDATGKSFVALVHDVVLVLDRAPSPAPLTVGDASGLVAETVFDDPTGRAYSPTVHVNQVGFAPDDRSKTAEVSPPLGVDSLAGPMPGFSVVDDSTGRAVLTGQPTPATPPPGGELGRGDLTGAPVWRLDFSQLDTPGRYRVCLDSIGCSYTFVIDPDVWTRLMVRVARAMYHQRSGIETGPPHSAVVRPMPFGPGSHRARQSTFSFLDSELAPSPFDGLTRGATSTIVEDTVGGHFDAGDWDRNVQHLWYLRAVSELVQDEPDRFASLTLDIPESGNDIPDLLDEGLWSLDLFMRLQLPDGAIRGGVESGDHPRYRTASWTDQLPLFVYGPDPWSSYVFAGAAADAAIALRTSDPERARVIAESAQRAMDWAERQPRVGATAERVLLQRAVAAGALLRLTGDRRWRDVFDASTTFDSAPMDLMDCGAHDLCDAAWEYVRADGASTDPGTRANVVESFRRNGESLLAQSASTTFGWTTEHPDVPLEWGLGLGGAPKGIGLTRAATVTGDVRYRDAAVRGAAASLGANPTDVVYITGTGTTPVSHPLIVDVQYAGLPNWPGTPVYGNSSVPAEFQRPMRDLLERNGVQPLPGRGPYLWSYADIYEMVPMNEFTVQQSHTAAVTVFGALSVR